jgi:hypothetical protein
MNKLEQALQLRGFFISHKDGYYWLNKGSQPDDAKELKRMFETLKIPATFIDDKFIVDTDTIDNRCLQEIIWYPARNHEAGGNGGWRSWKYFIKGIHGPKISTVSLETGVALFVKSLSAAGIRTVLSCDGHGGKAPIIAFLGRYNACWFMVLYRNIFVNLPLNYSWELDYTECSDVHLTAKSKAGNWNLQLVLEDTYLMANYLLENAQRISQIKRDLFGANRNSTRKLVKEMSLEELTDWMERRYLEKVSY